MLFSGLWCGHGPPPGGLAHFPPNIVFQAHERTNKGCCNRYIDSAALSPGVPDRYHLRPVVGRHPAALQQQQHHYAHSDPQQVRSRSISQKQPVGMSAAEMWKGFYFFKIFLSNGLVRAFLSQRPLQLLSFNIVTLWITRLETVFSPRLPLVEQIDRCAVSQFYPLVALWSRHFPFRRIGRNLGLIMSSLKCLSLPLSPLPSAIWSALFGSPTPSLGIPRTPTLTG